VTPETIIVTYEIGRKDEVQRVPKSSWLPRKNSRTDGASAAHHLRQEWSGAGVLTVTLDDRAADHFIGHRIAATANPLDRATIRRLNRFGNGKPGPGRRLGAGVRRCGSCCLLPFIGLLWVPFYNFQEPALFGFPFFYWYQLAWVRSVRC